MENVRNFIDLISNGQNTEAKDVLDDILSTRAFDALDARKKDISSSIFGGENVEVQDTADTPMEEPTEQE
jgi:hypothetical protein